MGPHPQHCLICSAEITSGIDAHIRNTHQMNYEEYCKYFYDAMGRATAFPLIKQVELS